MSQPVSDLSARIITLHESLKQTLQLIQRLSTFHASADRSGTATPTGDGATSEDTVADLAGEILDALNQQEEELELLKLDVEDTVLPGSGSARKTARREGERERERDREANNLHTRCAKLTEDVALYVINDPAEGVVLCIG